MKAAVCGFLFLVAIGLLSESRAASGNEPAGFVCDQHCRQKMGELFEAQIVSEANETYSAVRCTTVNIETSRTYNLGPQFSSSPGEGKGLINGRITIRCVPYSGRRPVIYIKKFIIDSSLNILKVR